MDELALEFELDSRLDNDCITLGDFPLSRLLLMNDAQYPWFILVPRRAEMSEIYHLSLADQAQLLHESSFLAETIHDVFAADKINIGAIGNMVNQLHIHHVVRYKGDAAWPAPVWGAHPAKPYTAEQIEEIHRKLQLMMPPEVNFVTQDLIG
ncbi:HIT domain-containing protein [Amphritea sp. 2_MG-2023]|jgi:diadenosine tetraphosphate (Ap4A) HIT family hydrolase|uniref:HIT domain-containing protein n=1 Tax=Amphritea TaxID=515417 RepID=UPI001C06B154|nr:MULTISPECIES: HIT domain-containing protein [Amphritea]MBU2966453.1 HIT domain-containing protein [Amphritea atlantica]MDO6417688.1 HIT domain-containing protein [Amphritea sp. 2_MG-2023]MDX2422533.1 HIT domain-containing protein [Amphritea sp.]